MIPQSQSVVRKPMTARRLIDQRMHIMKRWTIFQDAKGGLCFYEGKIKKDTRPGYWIGYAFDLVFPIKFPIWLADGKVLDGESQLPRREVVERAPKKKVYRSTIYARDGHKCLACGTLPTKDNWLSIDHIVPLSRGGSYDMNNLQTLCRNCNTMKGNRIIDYRVTSPNQAYVPPNGIAAR